LKYTKQERMRVGYKQGFFNFMSNTTGKTWIYLMRDLRSDLIKIGFSNNPRYRERTLQSEQPLIDLIEAWQADKSDEKYLHNQYKDFRLRGEWFKLNTEAIDEIHSYFFEHIQLSTGKTAEILYLESHNEYLTKKILELEEHLENAQYKLDESESIRQDLYSELEGDYIEALERDDVREQAKESFNLSRESLLESTKLLRLPSLPKRALMSQQQRQTLTVDFPLEEIPFPLENNADI
jgi:hypothetical protein